MDSAISRGSGRVFQIINEIPEPRGVEYQNIGQENSRQWQKEYHQIGGQNYTGQDYPLFFFHNHYSIRNWLLIIQTGKHRKVMLSIREPFVNTEIGVDFDYRRR
jgi:hypothetical protein